MVCNCLSKTWKKARYSTKERDFANTNFPAMEDTGIIVRRSSPWGARTNFPPKKKGLEDLMVVHNFIPVNKYTIKSSYPVYRLEEVLDTIVKPGYNFYFSSDAANGYWAIPMKQGDENKTGLMTANGQWVYLTMEQGLKGAAHTYSQFSDLVFGPLPGTSNGKVKRESKFIGRNKDAVFSIYMDDQVASACGFDAMYEFLATKYFLRVAFGPLYLSGKKTRVCDDRIEILGYEGNEGGLMPSLKHRQQI